MSIRYPQLNDVAWLKEQYIEGKKSTNEIARMVGCKASNSVRQALLKANIPVRSISSGLAIKSPVFCENWEFDKSILDGCLLGDAYFQIWNPDSLYSYPVFCKKNKYSDHILFVANSLMPHGKYSFREESKLCNGKYCQYFSCRSGAQPELKLHYEEWYPLSNNRVKVIPRSVNIDATVLLHWFMDDGCAHQRIREGKLTNQILIVFSSESFSKEDQDWICEQFNVKYDLGLKTFKYREGTGWRIKVPQAKARQFYEVIGPCPVPSLAYKWK